MPEVSRGYRSPLRERRRARTDAALLRAARWAFIRDGVLGARIEAIARAAGVAVPTVYKNVGGKRELLRKLLDGAPHAESRLLDAARRASGAERLRLLARVGRRIVEGMGVDLLRVTLAAAASDRALARVVRRESATRRRDHAKVIAALAADGDMRTDLTVDEAIDVTWTIVSPETYLLLVSDRRWSPDRWEAWAGDTLIKLLMRGRRERINARARPRGPSAG
jgi:AcrR family transcriptional regulator